MGRPLSLLAEKPPKTAFKGPAMVGMYVDMPRAKSEWQGGF